MDLGQLAAILSHTFDPATRVDAEKRLDELNTTPGFVSMLLQVLMSNEVQQPIRQAGSIYFKNMVSRSWRERSVPNGHQPFVIGLEDKAVVRSNIIEAIIHSPPLVRKQLTVCVSQILNNDYPHSWPDPPQVIHSYLASDNRVTWYGALIVLYQIVKKFEFKKTEERSVFHSTIREFLPLLYQRCVECMQDQSVDSTRIRHMIVKSVFGVFQYHLPTDVLTEQVLPAWMQLYQAILDQEPPQECTQLDEDERERSPWWKLQKWAIHSLVRLFERYGTPGSVDTSYEQFALYFCKTYAVSNTQTVLKILDRHRRNIYVSPRVLQLALNYLKNGVSNALHWKIMRPHMQAIIVEVIYPMLCHTDEDEELWQDDPYEFIRFKYDVYEDFVSPITAAQSLLHKATEKRKQILDPVMNFCVQVLNMPVQNRDPRQKDGVLHMIGTLSDILLKKKKYKDHMEMMLVHHVFPEATSPLGFMQARVCWVIHHFSATQFQSVENLRRAVDIVRGSLIENQDLPVRVEAAIALRYLIRAQPQVKQFIAPHIQAIIHELLFVIRSTENDDLTDALQDIIRQFSDDPKLGEMAVVIAQHLATTFQNLLDSEECDDKAVTAMGILTNFETMLSVISSKAIRDELEKIVFNVIASVFKDGIIDFYEDVLSIMVTATLYEITPIMWDLFYLMHDTFNSDGFDYFADMASPLHNYITVDPVAFLRNPKNMDIVYSMCKKVLMLDDIGEDAQLHAGKILEVVILQFPGQINQWIAPFAEAVLARLTRNVKTSELRVMCLQVVIASIYYNPDFLTTILDKLHLPDSQEPVTVQFFAQWIDDANCFLGVHDRKMFVLGLSSILGIHGSQRPRGLCDCATKIIPSLLLVFSGLQRSYERQAMLANGESDDENDGEDDSEEELGSDDDELNEDEVVYVESLAKRMTDALCSEEDDDEETDLESYTTTIDLEDAVDEFVAFKQCLLKIQVEDPAWYGQLTSNLIPKERQDLEKILVLADQRRAAIESRKLEMQGGYNFSDASIPNSFAFAQQQ